jgi:uroporphyrinogen-III synthase
VIAPAHPHRRRATPPRATRLRRLADGDYEWLFVTSAASVEQLAVFLSSERTLPTSLRIAAVGQATARAVAELGANVDFVPLGRLVGADHRSRSGARRTAQATGRCLVVRSDLAGAVVSDELGCAASPSTSASATARSASISPRRGGDLAAGRFAVVLLTPR